MIGHLTQKTNNGTVCRGTEPVGFEHDDVSRWGLLVAYGERNRFLAAELRDGRTVTVLEGVQDAEGTKWVRRKKRKIEIDARAIAAIRSSRTAGIIWESFPD